MGQRGPAQAFDSGVSARRSPEPHSTTARNQLTRAYGLWFVEAGEPMPRSWNEEAVRLAELGELDDSQLAALRERAMEAGLRVGTPDERISGRDRSTAAGVELWGAGEAGAGMTTTA